MSCLFLKRKSDCTLREIMVRILLHFYNTKDEFEMLIFELKQIIN